MTLNPQEESELRQITAENLHLREEVKKRTAELELKNRELEIETALERVRSRTMGMQKSEELKEVIRVVYDQFVHLNINIEHTGFILDYKNRDDMLIWLADQHEIPSQVIIPYFDCAHWNSFKEAKEKGIDFFANQLSFEEKNKFYQDLFNLVPGVPEESLNYYFSCPGLAISTVLLDNVGLYIENFSGIPYTDEENAVLMRFGKVFQQTYTRFLDLQKAEAQAREALIEAALERVRSRTMAMQRSDELAEAAQLLYHEFGTLGINTFTCGYQFIKEEQNIQSAWVVLPDGTLLPNFIDFPLTGDHVLDDRYKAWKEQKPLHLCEVKGEVNKEHHRFLSNHVPASVVDDFFSRIPDRIIFYSANFSNGYLFIISLEFFSPAEEQTVIRFAKVFEQTYTRFLDLQKAEAQTREAQIETGLERVRSRTMAMQSCDELAETASVVLHELISLGIAPSRLYIAIIEKDQTDVHFYLTNEDGGKDCSVYTAQIEKNITIRKMYNAWADHRSSISLNMEGDELTTYFNYLRDEVGVPFKSTQNPSRRVQTIAYFSQGYIGIASPDDPPEETKKLLERFAAVFNLTYTRFNDLKQAEKLAYQANLDLIRLKEEKARTELALAELKSAQAQLIQSEKMASLGELTAGIAHEIQNPLNFVNNFSDVNTELIDELNDELATGNMQLAIEIAGNIKDNEQKINHHGKRADAIVKSMLQHSRSSSNKKEPTDINALADEYLRLAYHGLRAKDKSFNAAIKTDFDESIGLINVVPQDIGRVLLNLITNAFYAVSSSPAPKSPEGDFKFQPTVTVTTKRKSPSGDLGAEVEIRVRDNGPGIPKNVLDKIFQPFFTTKPTGQGTGLGLSLSYDIIKAHGGELKVETKEGEGAEFIIVLPIA